MSSTIQFCQVVITAAAMLLCLSGLGCKQVSYGLRSEPVTEGDLIPPSPEPQSTPQPQSPLYVPPPAPPMDAARNESPNDFWNQVDQEVAGLEGDEFFSEQPLPVPPALSRHRGMQKEYQLAAEARNSAARREWERKHMLPIIVPGKSVLTRVSGQEPSLLPVPATK